MKAPGSLLLTVGWLKTAVKDVLALRRQRERQPPITDDGGSRSIRRAGVPNDQAERYEPAAPRRRGARAQAAGGPRDAADAGGLLLSGDPVDHAVHYPKSIAA